jgi:BirA family biotin operon repressor/biotin-[acetyl-CoA-carboxylase] ligase
VLIASYRSRCSTLGATVRVELADGAFEGVALDITDDGHLVVREKGSGARREVVTGDVVHVRAV